MGRISSTRCAKSGSNRVAPAQLTPDAPHAEPADVRQYFGPGQCVDVGYLARASPRLMRSERRSGKNTLVQVQAIPSQ
jgi:hypothetical protein